MVQFSQITATNNDFAKENPLIAVFVGATSGIGELTLRSLCKTYGIADQKLRIYLVGRNASTAEKIIDDCTAVYPKVQLRFVKTEDLSLLRNIDKACDEVKRLEVEEENSAKPRVDVLVMSQGEVMFGGRKETKEGLDMSMSLLFYSRMRMVDRLIPLLLESDLQGGARIISVYAGGLENKGKLFIDDLSLRKSGHYNFSNCRTNVIYMKTMYFESLAQKYPGKLSLIHVFPGLVITPSFDNSNHPLWARAAWTLAKPLAKTFFSVDPRSIGQRILFFCGPRFPAQRSVEEKITKDDQIAISTDGVVAGGAYSAQYTGETCDVARHYMGLRENGFQNKVWQHVTNAFEAIEKDGVFTQ